MGDYIRKGPGIALQSQFVSLDITPRGPEVDRFEFARSRG